MKIRLYLDEETEPFREISNSEKFEVDTTRVPDGPHVLRIETVEDGRVTGLRRMSFTVRNGPGIAVAGIEPGDEVRGALKLTVNASAAGIDSKFDAHSMETHRGIPFWAGGFAAVVILACAAYLATDASRRIGYEERAQEVAKLLGKDFAAKPAIPIDAQPPAGSAAAAIEKPPHPQHLTLADGEFLDIIPLAGKEADAEQGGVLFAAKCSGCHGADGEGAI